MVKNELIDRQFQVEAWLPGAKNSAGRAQNSPCSAQGEMRREGAVIIPGNADPFQLSVQFLVELAQWPILFDAEPEHPWSVQVGKGTHTFYPHLEGGCKPPYR